MCWFQFLSSQKPLPPPPPCDPLTRICRLKQLADAHFCYTSLPTLPTASLLTFAVFPFSPNFLRCGDHRLPRASPDRCKAFSIHTPSLVGVRTFLTSFSSVRQPVRKYGLSFYSKVGLDSARTPSLAVLFPPCREFVARHSRSPPLLQ